MASAGEDVGLEVEGWGVGLGLGWFKRVWGFFVDVFHAVSMLGGVDVWLDLREYV